MDVGYKDVSTNAKELGWVKRGYSCIIIHTHIYVRTILIVVTKESFMYVSSACMFMYESIRHYRHVYVYRDVSVISQIYLQKL